MLRLTRVLLPASLLLCLVGCESDRMVLTVERDYPIGTYETLLLDQRAGDLMVIGEADRDTVQLVVELRSRRVGKDSDQDAIEALRVGLGEIDTTIGRIAAGLDDAPRGYYVDVTAFVPHQVAMEIEDDSGDTSIENVAALTLHDDSGDIRISDIAGTVIVDDDSGDLRISGVAGDLWIDDDSGDISVTGVQGNVDVSDDSGDIGITTVGGDVTLNDRSGDIVVRDAAGTVRVDDRSGDIVIENAGDAQILSDSSGDVSIR